MGAGPAPATAEGKGWEARSPRGSPSLGLRKPQRVPALNGDGEGTLCGRPGLPAIWSHALRGLNKTNSRQQIGRRTSLASNIDCALVSCLGSRGVRGSAWNELAVTPSSGSALSHAGSSAKGLY